MNTITDAAVPLRPADVCRALLSALEASEGRRRKRKRDQTPDVFGLSVKRDLLQRAIGADPAPEAFEQWLLNYPLTCKAPELAGPTLAMARAVFEEWRLAHTLPEFRIWLEHGAPSDDVADANERQRVSHASGEGSLGPRERPPTPRLRRGPAVALRAEAEACEGSGDASPRINEDATDGTSR